MNWPRLGLRPILSCGRKLPLRQMRLTFSLKPIPINSAKAGRMAARSILSILLALFSELNKTNKRFPFGMFGHFHASRLNAVNGLPRSEVYPLAWTGRPPGPVAGPGAETTLSGIRSEEHTSELQSHLNLVCRLLLEKKKQDQSAQPITHYRRRNRTHHSH